MVTRVPAVRVVKITDIPEEIFPLIYRHFKNIREIIRLARVCRLFYVTVMSFCEKLRYRIVSRADYQFESEIKKKSLLYDILNLTQLLAIAPHCTHFIERSNQVCFDNVQVESKIASIFIPTANPVPFHYLTYLYINENCSLNDKYHIKEKINHVNCERITWFLDDAPNLETLHLSIDHPTCYQIKETKKLKRFIFDYFIVEEFYKHQESPLLCLGIIDGKAPNLEDFILNTCYSDVTIQLPDILERISENCQNLTFLKLFFKNSEWSVDHMNSVDPPNAKLSNLQEIHVSGCPIPVYYWQWMITDVFPNIKIISIPPLSDPHLIDFVTHYGLLRKDRQPLTINNLYIQFMYLVQCQQQTLTLFIFLYKQVLQNVIYTILMKNTQFHFRKRISNHQIILQNQTQFNNTFNPIKID